jgi:hypothetical protein
MKKRFFWGWIICLTVSAAQAQQATEIEALKRQLQQATENFDKTLQEHRKIMDDLNRRLQQVQAEQGRATSSVATAASTAPSAAPSPAPPKSDVGSLGGNLTEPMRIGSRRAYMDIGLVGTFAAGSSTASDINGGTQLGGHDPNQRGFTVQGVEASFTGAVDPYFRGAANVVFGLDADGESFLELEEGYAETMALPGNLQLRAGQYLTEFGRHNPTHPHSWAFADTPLVNGRFLGSDGLRNPGARISWLMPTPFYSEVALGVQNSHGETAAAFRSAGAHTHGGEEAEELPLAFRHADNDRGLKHVQDLLFAPRYAMSFDLTDAQTVLLGASAAFGPNARGEEGAGDTDTQLYGLDFMWKWKPTTHAAGFPFVAWQTEAMLRRYEVGTFNWGAETNGLFVTDDTTAAPAVLPGETLTDYGFYTQLLYGFRRGWVAGLRVDYVTGERGDYERLNLSVDGEPLGRDPQRAQRWRISPNLTWYPSEFSKLRLQYNYDDRKGIGVDHSVWLQFEFILGAHAAHKF